MTEAEQQLETFFDKYTPEQAAAGRAALAKLRALLPGATQLIYDNWNGLVVGFGPSEKASAATVSLLFRPEWTTLCLLYGKSLDDPHKLMKGEGNQVRNVRLVAPLSLDDSRVVDLVRRAVEAGKPWDPDRPSQLIVKSVSARQRPRR